jgi:hypothetical protein
MAKFTINFSYGIGDIVKIIEIESVGRIDGLSYDLKGEMCRVVYWNNGERHSVWLYPSEIKIK